MKGARRLAEFRVARLEEMKMRLTSRAELLKGVPAAGLHKLLITKLSAKTICACVFFFLRDIFIESKLQKPVLTPPKERRMVKRKKKRKKRKRGRIAAVPLSRPHFHLIRT